MVPALAIIFFLNTLILIFLAFRKPYWHIHALGREFVIESYAIGVLFGPVALVLLGLISLPEIASSLASGGDSNPIGIAVLFLSMVFISIYLDTVGVLEFCAGVAINRAGNSGKRLFFILYLTVSFLTLFTSNDIIILTLTPFIYYFARHAKIDPIPYLLAEFFAANTWSTMLLIGNPTNIFISTAYGVKFFEYLRIMLIPTLAGGIANALIIYYLFRGRITIALSAKSRIDPFESIRDRNAAIIGSIMLLLCLIAISIGPYLGITMWKITLAFAVILACYELVRHAMDRRHAGREGFLEPSMRKMPWSIIPFLFSFFVVVSALRKYSVTAIMAHFLGMFGSTPAATVFTYGLSSALSANLINNIPMSVLFTSVMSGLPGNSLQAAIYSTVIGSNIGAYITPIGALAGIMWMNILKHKKIHLSLWEFIRTGSIVALVTLAVMLIALSLVLAALG